MAALAVRCQELLFTIRFCEKAMFRLFCSTPSNIQNKPLSVVEKDSGEDRMIQGTCGCGVKGCMGSAELAKAMRGYGSQL